MLKKLILTAISAWALSPTWAAQPNDLPTLGDSTSGIVSSEQEYKLGQAWVRELRARAPIIQDPLINDYAQRFVSELLTYSQVRDPRTEVLVINNDKLNAFAAPGGVIGIHAGLFFYAKTEDEFASVMAHELAHLSQRHFARGMQAASERQLPSMIGVLAGIALIAAGQGQAGMATATTAQAANAQSALAYSRQNEQEADRVGMQTLVNAGYDPNAMPSMFERMNALYGRNNRMPEFLQTHPLSQSRIADTRNRAEQYPKGSTRPPNPEYELIQSRVKVTNKDNYTTLVNDFKGLFKTTKTPVEKEAALYGAVVALTKAKRFGEAQTELNPLIQANPNYIPYVYAQAEIYTSNNNPKAALTLLEQQPQGYSKNYALTCAYIDALIKDKQFKQAESIVKSSIAQTDDDTWMWRRLADIYQLTQNAIDLHIAKAQIAFLYGNYDRALSELKYALSNSKNNYVTTAIIREKQKEIEAARDYVKSL